MPTSRQSTSRPSFEQFWRLLTLVLYFHGSNFHHTHSPSSFCDLHFFHTGILFIFGTSLMGSNMCKWFTSSERRGVWKRCSCDCVRGVGCVPDGDILRPARSFRVFLCIQGSQTHHTVKINSAGWCWSLSRKSAVGVCTNTRPRSEFTQHGDSESSVAEDEMYLMLSQTYGYVYEGLCMKYH